MKQSHKVKNLISRRLQTEKGNLFRQGGPRIAMLYPSPYRAGMSSLGYQWIIEILQTAGFSVERVFLPDNIEDWKNSKTPLISYETQTPLSHFPVIGVSLAYELELGGLIQCLQGSGIPIKREERSIHDPKIILGGPITFSNPLPTSPFVDAILLGEVEDIVVSVFKCAIEFSNSAWKEAIAKMPGVFIPETMKDLPAIAKASDTLLPARSHIISPEAELKNMFLIEGERGCHRSCTFCVMRRSTNGGMRLVTPERILSFVPDHAERVGLVGAAISDHPKLPSLLAKLVESGREIGVSSLRADRVARKPDIARLLRMGGYKTLTVASDAPSQRLRKEISKGTLEKHIIDCARQAAEHKYRILKVYMMLGLPDENTEDIQELIKFTLELAKIHPVALGVAPFVPKKNTPLDSAPFAGIKKVDHHIKILRKGLKVSKGRAEVRPTSSKWAWVEYMLAQGGPETGLATLEAVENGGSFASWKRALRKLDSKQMSPWRRSLNLVIGNNP